jgi:hypothetical protein
MNKELLRFASVHLKRYASLIRRLAFLGPEKPDESDRIRRIRNYIAELEAASEGLLNLSE